MNFNDMSNAQLRTYKRKKTIAFAKTQKSHRDEMLEIQAVLDIQAKAERVRKYSEAIGPDAVSAIVEAALADAKGDKVAPTRVGS